MPELPLDAQTADHGFPEPNPREAWGLDGCKQGWFFFCLKGEDARYGVVRLVAELVDQAAADAPIFVDIPIGLHERSDVERTCDLEARRALSPHRTSSVFPAPCRSAVYASSYEEAAERNRACMGKGLSKQSWAIAPKIREVDGLLQERPDLQPRVREVHPEVCFWGLTGAPMPQYKKTAEGFDDRVEALTAVYPPARDVLGRAFLQHGGFDAQRDDLVDALVAAVCAAHVAECRTLPEDPELDPTGLRMEMVYWPAGGA